MEQRRPRSACAFAQADQGLRCPQITLRPISCVAHQMLKLIEERQEKFNFLVNQSTAQRL